MLAFVFLNGVDGLSFLHPKDQSSYADIMGSAKVVFEPEASSKAAPIIQTNLRIRNKLFSPLYFVVKDKL